MTTPGAYGADMLALLTPGVTTPALTPVSRHRYTTPASVVSTLKLAAFNGVSFSAAATRAEARWGLPQRLRYCRDAQRRDGKKPTPEQVRMIEAGPAPTSPWRRLAVATSMIAYLGLVDTRALKRAWRDLTRKANASRMRAGLNTLDVAVSVAPTDELREGSRLTRPYTHHSYANNLVKEYGLRLGVSRTQMLVMRRSGSLPRRLCTGGEFDRRCAGAQADHDVQMLQFSDECAGAFCELQQVTVPSNVRRRGGA